MKDIYKAGPDNVWPSGLPHDDASIVDNDHKWNLVDLELFSPIDDLDKLTLWTRAFFEVKVTASETINIQWRKKF